MGCSNMYTKVHIVSSPNPTLCEGKGMGTLERVHYIILLHMIMVAVSDICIVTAELDFTGCEALLLKMLLVQHKSFYK